MKALKDVHSFLGLAGYYRNFIRKFLSIASLPTKLTQKGTILDWTPNCEKTFFDLRNAFTTAPVHCSPNYKTQFTLTTDASNRELGQGRRKLRNIKEGINSYCLGYKNTQTVSNETKLPVGRTRNLSESTSEASKTVSKTTSDESEQQFLYKNFTISRLIAVFDKVKTKPTAVKKLLKHMTKDELPLFNEEECMRTLGWLIDKLANKKLKIIKPTFGYHLLRP